MFFSYWNCHLSVSCPDEAIIPKNFLFPLKQPRLPTAGRCPVASLLFETRQRSASDKKGPWRGEYGLVRKMSTPFHPQFIMFDHTSPYVYVMILCWFPMDLLTCVEPPASDMKTRSSGCWPMHARSTTPSFLMLAQTTNHGPGLLELEWLTGMANGGCIRTCLWSRITGTWFWSLKTTNEKTICHQRFEGNSLASAPHSFSHVTPNMLRWVCVLCILHAAVQVRGPSSANDYLLYSGSMSIDILITILKHHIESP